MSDTKARTNILNENFAERHPSIAAAFYDGFEQESREPRSAIVVPVDSEVEIIEPGSTELFPVPEPDFDEQDDSRQGETSPPSERTGTDRDPAPPQRPRFPRRVVQLLNGKTGQGDNLVDLLHERFIDKELPWVPYSKAEMHTAARGLDGWLARNSMGRTSVIINRVEQVDRWIRSSGMFAEVLNKYDSGEASADEIKEDLEALHALALHDMAATSVSLNTWPLADSKATKTNVEKIIRDLEQLTTEQLRERALHVHAVALQRGTFWREEVKKVSMHPRILEARSILDHPHSHR